MIDIINHAVWLWALPNKRKTSWVGDKNCTQRYKNGLLQIKGVAGGGSGYVQTKTNGIRFILFLFTKLCGPAEKKWVEMIRQCSQSASGGKAKYDNDRYDVPDGVKNLLLYLCDSDYYEPIASTDDKKKIVKAFDSIVPEAEKKEDIDSEIQIIKSLLVKLNCFKDSFYSGSLPLMWKGESTTDLSLVQKLEYKKALILYGPPGTGKTHTAKELAKEIIIRYHMKLLNKDNICGEDLKFFTKIEKGNDDYISYLQFHINYNYEDFIAGQVFDGQSIKTKKGFIFDVINKATNPENSEKPYVVILDEINRTDISRVFGELFTAIEKRGENVTLTLPDPDNSTSRLVLNLPENIYFIGTMNEIDFSLERVDFALRRRFIWEFHDYSESALESMINDRLAGSSIEEEVDIDGFCNSCTNLNKKVEEAMGDAYHIGHAFFAEIANIFNQLGDNKVSDPWRKAKKVLWEISIKPTLDAYCGLMEKAEKDKYLKARDGVFYKAFFSKEELTDAGTEA
jgi:5-methylcytosine-specific restriction protein B